MEPIPRSSGNVVRMYTCGPTVYSDPHIGNMRAYACADVLRRAMRGKALEVRQVVNFTDVGHLLADSDDGEDKIEKSARADAVSVWDLTDHYIREFLESSDLLGIQRADDYPRATAYIDGMIDFIARLERRNLTYVLPSGVYFDTSKLPSYGAMARTDTTSLLEGARIGQIEGRRHKSDFALWRLEKPGERRLMRWESPWGWGAPGWHIECSVMSMALLGEHFEVHTGGVDHRELHHVNEIAQSEAYLDDGAPWVRHWFHNEFLVADGRKLSKSAGDRVTVKSLVADGYWPSAIRYLFATASYRTQLTFSEASLDTAQRAVEHLHERFGPLPGSDPIVLAEVLPALPSAEARTAVAQIDAHLSNDLATPSVLATVHGLSLKGAELEQVAHIALGLLGIDPRPVKATAAPAVDEAAVSHLLAQREQARSAADWARADAIRKQLADMGVKVVDTPSGPQWSAHL